MKWKDFRELLPLERRLRHSKEHRVKKALAKWVREAKQQPRLAQFLKEPLDSNLRNTWLLLLSFLHADKPQDYVAWLNKHFCPNQSYEGWVIAAPQMLLTAIKQHPLFTLGFWNERNEFIPGLLAVLADNSYADPVEEILSVENLSGMTIDEVVAICAKRGFKTNNDAVRQRVRHWDSGKTKIFP